MVIHLRNGKNGMNAAVAACSNGNRATESTPNLVDPKTFVRAILYGDACKCCIPIFNARNAMQIKLIYPTKIQQKRGKL